MISTSGIFRLVLCAWATLAVAIDALAAPKTMPPAGLRENTPSVHAFIGARLVVAPGKVTEQGILIIRDGTIVGLGQGIEIPAGARIWDLAGKTIYAGLIDAGGEQAPSVNATASPTAYWNHRIAPERRAFDHYESRPDVNQTYRAAGIATRLVAPSAGIIKGTSVLVTTGDEAGSRAILRSDVALHMVLMPARSEGDDNYPNSPMGAMSLVRQALYDAQWYARAWEAYGQNQLLARPERNESLEALGRFLGTHETVIIDARDELYFLRAHQVANEFGLNLVVRGSGEEYQRLDAIRASGRPVLVPVNFPKAPHVATPEAARSVGLDRLLHWDLAPENPGRLDAAGVRIALSTHGLADVSQFLANIRKAVRRGLSAEAALRALTTTPAELLGADDRLGTLDVGKAANLLVVEGDLFADTGKLLETWVDGRRYVVLATPAFDARGTWELQTSLAGVAETLRLELGGEPDKLSGKILRAEKSADLSQVVLDGRQLTATFPGESLGSSGIVQLSVTMLLAEPSAANQEPPACQGILGWSDGSRSDVSGKRTALWTPPLASATPPDPIAAAPSTPTAAPIANALFPVSYPLGAFGRQQPPEQPKLVVFQHATVWTGAAAGILEDATVLVESGRITQVGQGLAIPPDALVLNLAGKHLTAGVIDCHSHIATDGGVNESGQTISAEVRIGDFIDPDDVNIYRQLAGGVTCAHILHGSANTIGGQCQVIKFRWGALPNEMKFEQASPSIKFALGENVKQSNWGDRFTTRYPQTRMGVEQLVRDAFQAALEYRRHWDEWRDRKQGLPPRVDLELEALAEVLAGKRIIHCHSYRQDEILALLRTCEEFGVRVGTLQHILEGYKVADELARHGVAGSAFSDWWAYKFEVYDAIPYNGALMHRAGVVVSFNSDSAELARRLHLEAGKAVKYGGVNAHEAWKFVTLNAARQMGIDSRTGSIKPGKDADLAVWSTSPISSYARCEQTWVDGRRYFDLAEDAQRRAEEQSMRAALVQRILTSGEPQAGPDEGKKDAWPREDVFCHDHDHSFYHYEE